MFCKQSESWEIATNYYCVIRVKSLQIFLNIALMAFFLHKFAISFPNKICKKKKAELKLKFVAHTRDQIKLDDSKMEVFSLTLNISIIKSGKQEQFRNPQDE